MEPQVGELADQRLVRLGHACDSHLDALLADLLRGRLGPVGEQLRDVRALGPLLRALGDAAPEPRREAGLGARVAGRPVRADAHEDRVAVAVLLQLLDVEERAGGLALVPELLPRAAEEPGLAGLLRAPQRLLVHPGQHQNAVRVRVLDDRRLQIAFGSAILPPSAPASSTGCRSGRLVDDRRDERRLGARLERLGEVRDGAGAARGDDRNGHCVADGARDLEVVALPGAVRVDRREEDLPGAAPDCLLRPLDGVDPARRAAAVGDDLARLRVDRADDGLRAELLGQLGEELRVLDRGAVDRDLVRAGAQQRRARARATRCRRRR